MKPIMPSPDPLGASNPGLPGRGLPGTGARPVGALSGGLGSAGVGGGYNGSGINPGGMYSPGPDPAVNGAMHGHAFGGGGPMNGTPPFMKPGYRPGGVPSFAHALQNNFDSSPESLAGAASLGGGATPVGQSMSGMGGALPWESMGPAGIGGTGPDKFAGGVMMGGGVEGPAHYGTVMNGPPPGYQPPGPGASMTGYTPPMGPGVVGQQGPQPVGRMQLAKLLSGGRNV